MNVVEKALSSARFNRLLLWFGVAIFAVGALVLVLKLVGNTNGETPASTTLTPAKSTPSSSRSVPLKSANGARIRSYEQLDPKIRTTVRTFIDAAVARHNQARAWPITTANLRSGFTKKEWDTSDALPVVPYPIWNRNHVNVALEWAKSDQIMLDVGVSSKPSLHLRALTFNLALVPVGRGVHKRWLVDYWMPLYTPPIPIN